MQTDYTPQNCIDLINQKFDSSALISLIEYIRIPNLSRDFDPEWETNGLLENAAEHIKNWVESLGLMGLSTEIIKDKGYSPIIFTEIAGELPYTILYYGHFDKQPPFTGWSEGLGPNSPVVKDNKLYGRGGADDGYSTYSTMLSIWALQKLGVKLPRCVMITEGDEESGDHIDHYLETLGKRIGTPQIIFCLDSGTIDYESLTLTTSLRGGVMLKLKVKILEEGIHSGDASGVVPSSFRIARQLLSRIQNSKTGQMISDLRVNIPPERYQQIYNFANSRSKEFFQHFHLFKKADYVYKSPMKSVIARNWSPQMEITGSDGLPPADTAGNVLRPQTILKLSIRIPPTLNPEKAFETIKSLLTKDTPYNASVEIVDHQTWSGWNAPKFSNYLSKAIDFSSDFVFKSGVVKMGEGGSIPLMNTLQKMYPKAQFLITGVLGPHANAHGPNQFLHLPYCKKLTCAMSIILQDVSNHLANVTKK